MRTRIPSTAEKSAANNARCASIAAAAASSARAKTAQNASPTVLKTAPPCVSIAFRMMRS